MLTIPRIFAGALLWERSLTMWYSDFPGTHTFLAAVTAAIFLDSTFIKSLRGEKCYAYDVYK
ncbi:MAG: hypothetical protein DMG67_14295 [Acidobacteria bacterium]|nr:MAG: hypothetical protein DMG67_14295 [Acidobacteriota bacterium]